MEKYSFNLSGIFFLVVFLLLISSGNINYAKLIYRNTPVSEKKLAYTFKVGDKMFGNGEMVLTFDKNKIKGTALGIGMTCQWNVDFYTNIEGTLDANKGNVSVKVIGVGDPFKIPLPGKINFNGPLKGLIDHKKLNLSGKVNIKGKLARFAGFKKSENLVIEIVDPNFAVTLKELQRRKHLASL